MKFVDLSIMGMVGVLDFDSDLKVPSVRLFVRRFPPRKKKKKMETARVKSHFIEQEGRKENSFHHLFILE